jgi:NAD dependent epimerase/dehydratase family enzyme
MLGEVAGVLLGSQRVLPKRATDGAFSFRFRDVNDALGDVLRGRS